MNHYENRHTHTRRMMQLVLGKLLIVSVVVVVLTLGYNLEQPEAYLPYYVPSSPSSVVTGAPFPWNGNDEIRLDSMRVIMRLKPATYTLNATFVLYNSGKWSVVPIAFPIPNFRYPYSDNPAFKRFDLWVNGQKTQVTRTRDWVNIATARLRDYIRSGYIGEPPILKHLPEPGYQITLNARVGFPERESTTLRISCEGTYLALWAGGNEALFVAETASRWHGNIKNATMIIDCSELGGVKNCRFDAQRFDTDWDVTVGEDTIRLEKSNYDRLKGRGAISVSVR